MESVNDFTCEGNRIVPAAEDQVCELEQRLLKTRLDLRAAKEREAALQQRLTVQGQRVDELEALLLKLKEPTDEMVELGNGAAVVEMEHDAELGSCGWISNSDEVLSAMIDAALNPTAEAASHE